MTWLETAARATVVGWLLPPLFIVVLLLALFGSQTPKDQADGDRAWASVQAVVARQKAEEAKQH